MSVEYDLESIRAKMRSKKVKIRNEHEWRPDKAEQKTLRWQFFILPPTDNMELWYYEHGSHFINNRLYECPRVHNDGIQCPLCQFAFDLMKDIDDKEKRREIARKYLPSSRYAVNIYFPPLENTQQELRDKVMWFSMPQSVFRICEEVIMRDPPAVDAIGSEPWGVFFDPDNAMLMLLEARKKGDFNSYESSRFLNKKMPIAKTKEKIASILAMRHDIASMFAERDVETLQEIVNSITGVNVKPLQSVTKTSDKANKLIQNDSDDEEEEDTTVKEKNESTNKSKVEEDDEDLGALLEELNS